MRVTTQGAKLDSKQCHITFEFDPEDYKRLLDHGIRAATTLDVNPPLSAYEITKQPVQHTLEIADLLANISNSAVEWAEEFLEEHDPCPMLLLRECAYTQACNMFDGEDGCILKNDNPTEYEHEVLITTYVISAIQYAQQHTVVK